MTTQGIKRKLTAILSADVVGYRKIQFLKSTSWVLFILLQLLFFCFFYHSNWLFFRGVRNYPLTTISKDEAIKYRDRFENLRRLLPPHVRLGYFTDRGMKEFYLSQYNLTPNILLLNREMGYILEDFHDGKIPTSMSTRPGYLQIYNDGHGVRLFRRGKS